MNRFVSSILLLLLFVTATAQDINRYFVYFTDKSGDEYPYTLSNPSEFLTQKSIDRRLKQGLVVNESDLPVDPSFMKGLRTTGAGVFFSSRWMNGALIQMDESLLATVQNLSFVDSVALIAENSRLNSASQSPTDPVNFLMPPSMSGDSDIQLIMMNADRMHADDLRTYNGYSFDFESIAKEL